ncbi:MAG: TIGR01777 family protein [Deltaproteobacteria bacterium]|nr:TIGR01777 family protein [Deltaproteobacteria bacterium]
MKILVSGATGLVGQHLVRRLLEGGHEVIALSRDAEDATLNLPVRCRVHEWTPENGHLDGRALEGVEAVVHLAGENVGAGRWSDARKHGIARSRVEGTRTLVDAIAGLPAAARPRVFVSASAVGFYGDRGDEVLDETADSGYGFLCDVCRVWEHEARRIESAGVRWVSLRAGVVLAREDGALPRMLPAFRLGLGARLGSGRQWMSWIHIADLVSLFVFAIENRQLEGPVNAVSPVPLTNRDFTRTLARVLRRPALLLVPGTMLRWRFGEMSSLLLDSQRVRPTAAEEAGFRFDYSDLSLALTDLCADTARELRLEMWIDRSPREVFEFFADPDNLESTTPQSLGLRIVKAPQGPLHEGALLEYRLRLHGIPLRWRARVEVWDPPRAFVSSQLRGPCKAWRHTREFEPLDGGTVVRDIVRYEPPVGAVGEWMAGRRIEADIAFIFAYRRTRLLELLA